MSINTLLLPQPGLRVLITAGGSGIGAAIARAFHELGAQVHVCDIDRAALNRLTAEVPGIGATMADASVPQDVDLVFENVQSSLGGLDVLINNVGIAGPTAAIEDLDRDDWDRTVSVNLNSQFYFARRAVPMLKQSAANPCIIAMSSVAGRLGYAFRTPYASTKWATIGLMKSLAIELGPHGVRVNAILPGIVENERMNNVISARAAATGVSVQAMREEYLHKISLRRMVTMDDVAAMAAFLSSPAARNVTGQAISVDGNVEYL
ncbi:SDR family oxidoreductase [Noviherbaspirillum sedimenti]|uniref:SDR family oxidoreductase n=1 Tax=Noviherbaspirillum sedimenti TaxID=2320865 RepID=A0A3A3G5X3_9BURK|nr:SDR family oxidoreductase [Noviherbaspirillum sedimenti]RJG03923.1 SDR family oxidoreductase [Noviherbaspirillum sedimenti]